MLAITAAHRLYIAIHPIDFRRGIDGLRALCANQLNQDPMQGTLFAFRNKSGTSVKLLNYDGNGFWLIQKRFSQGRLKWWPTQSTLAIPLRAVELLIILQQGSPLAADVPDDWRKLPHPQ